MNNIQWDKKLKIETTGRDDAHADSYHHPYEGTPYSVLIRLAESGFLDKDSIVIDYGCGKGRVDFFLNYVLECHTIGIEYDERLYELALKNKYSYGEKSAVDFICMDAGAYTIKDADVFYFFNPFTVEILKSVIGKILESYYENPRTMRLFFYYPHNDFISYLMTMYELDFIDEIDCQDLFEGKNERERILVFGVG